MGSIAWLASPSRVTRLGGQAGTSRGPAGRPGRSRAAAGPLAETDHADDRPHVADRAEADAALAAAAPAHVAQVSALFADALTPEELRTSRRISDKVLARIDSPHTAALG
ncbi:hypothetical protein JOF53_007878 [Crossiella equi]|uniref:Uncharacterized protein n=1 Tax=Crossiella equi TaxID=130796 RepID=A0ABS5AR30_9PSEU|nr:hypothetical protein [Crossiella equi]MBP2479006.1 hypothetical protein [Crossiella equi]